MAPSVQFPGVPRPRAVKADGLALDALNFFLADVAGGLGPFLAIFLMTSQHWDASRIGVVLTAAGLTTVAARAPAGALVDAVAWKRGLIVAAAAVVAASAVAMALWPSFAPVVAAQIASGAADAIFPAAVAAISLGMVGRAAFTRRIGRNEAFNHAGNVATALAAGAAGTWIAPAAVLWLVAALSIASIAATRGVRADSIDHALARGGDDNAPGPHAPVGVIQLLENRRLVTFTVAITLFHFANAAMLPLVGEKLAQGHIAAGSLFMAACITTAQIVMVPMAVLVGRKADAWGRKPIFFAGFAVLPLRGVLFMLTQDPWALIAIQILDGVGAGIFGALFFIVVADLTRGTGRYNLAQGAAGACWGLGAALSNLVAGAIVDAFGFSAAFLVLAASAAVALVVFWLGVPETRPAVSRDTDPPTGPGRNNSQPPALPVQLSLESP